MSQPLLSSKKNYEQQFSVKYYKYQTFPGQFQPQFEWVSFRPADVSPGVTFVLTKYSVLESDERKLKFKYSTTMLEGFVQLTSTNPGIVRTDS